MASQQQKAELEEEKALIEQQMIEITKKIVELHGDIEIYLSEKFHLEMRLRIIEEELNLRSPSAKSTRTVVDKFSCQSMSKCTVCRHTAEFPKLKSQQLFNQDLKSSRASSPMSSILNRQSLQHSSAHTKHSTNAQSCKSIASCSLCRQLYLKPSTASTFNNSVLESKDTINAPSMCKSIGQCSLCHRLYLEPSIKASEFSKVQSEAICDDCVESILSENESLARKISVQADPSCKSLAQCSLCQKTFAGPSMKASETSKVCEECFESAVTLTQSKNNEADPSCNSLANCRLCRKAYLPPSELSKAQSKLSKAQSELSLCEDCNKSMMTDQESKVNASEKKIDIEPSCKSLANCSTCRKAFVSKASEHSKAQSEPVCENCESSMMHVGTVNADPSCKSLANCSTCRKAFAEPSMKRSEMSNASEPVCEDCYESKMSVLPSKVKNVSEVDQSCKSMAECSLCKKAFTETDSKMLDESKASVCQDCRESIISQFEEQLNKVYQTRSELEVKESNLTMKVDPSCKSLEACKMCQKAYNGPKGPMANVSEFDCTSFDMCELCSKVPEKSLETKMKPKSSGINPVADIVHSIYYSTTSMPAESVKSIIKKATYSGKSTPKRKNTKGAGGASGAATPSQKAESGKSTPKTKSKVTLNVGEEKPAELELKPITISKPKNACFDEEFCPPNLTEEEPSETASEIMEKKQLERLKLEEEKKKKEKKEADAAYGNFLSTQEAEMAVKPSVPCANDDAKQECSFLNVKESGMEVDENEHPEKIEYSKIYLEMKYSIQMQNYKISKMCQELKIMKQRGMQSQMAKLKEQLRKEIEKLKKMIEHAMKQQKNEPEGVWGSIPISTVSMANLEINSYEFEKVEMPKAPSNVTMSGNLFAEVDEMIIKEEKANLIKGIENRQDQERFECLCEKMKKMENELFVLKGLNEQLKMKDKYFDSVHEDFNPEEKIKDVEDTMNDLMEQLQKMKDGFDDIHLKLHQKV